MTIKIELKDSFYGHDFFANPIPVKHEVEWEGGDIAWDEHMVNFLTFLSMTGYVIEHSWIEKLQNMAQDLCNPPKIIAKKRTKK